MPHRAHPTILCIAIQNADLLTNVFENEAESTHKHHGFLWRGLALKIGASYLSGLESLLHGAFQKLCQSRLNKKIMAVWRLG